MKPGRRSKVAGSRAHAFLIPCIYSAQRWCAVIVAALCLARAALNPVQAATNATSFGVGATVVAPCVVTPQFLVRLKSAIGTSGLVLCMVGSNTATSPIMQPTTQFGRDPVTGLQTLTVEF